MQPNAADLYRRICDHSLDDANAQFNFTQRLARENEWTLDFARRVVDEYKRFMFLAVVAGHPVTPSEHVDQAWHLHLVYTRDYWDEFCGCVLGMPIHHGPTKGGQAEETKYHDWYSETKASYRRLFIEPPPADIWPEARVRFGDDLKWSRVNRARNWVIPKSSLTRLSLAGLAIAAILALVAAVPFGSSASTEGSDPALAPYREATSIDASMWSSLLAWQQPPPQPDPLPVEPVFIFAAIVMVVVVYSLVRRGNRCSNCRRHGGMKQTGSAEPGGFLRRTKWEWQCKYCGATRWKAEPLSGGCGGGDVGGCGGCGGCGGGCGGD